MDWELEPRARLTGRVRLPGDKSIAHRALILGAIADGDSVLRGLPTGRDVASTAHVLRSLGVDVETREGAHGLDATVRGGGLDGLREPSGALDCGNSGTTMRLMSGVLAGQPFEATLTGDGSLRRRPMGRVAEPLRCMGACVELAAGDRAPIRICGDGLRAVTYRAPVASAQVKSCVLLAGLYADGATTVVEPRVTRDHTERMLAAAGLTVEREGLEVRLRPAARLEPLRGSVPGDFSSAAYLLVAGALVRGSEVVLEYVGVNPTRSGLLDLLADWGVRTRVDRRDGPWGEPIAELLVRGGHRPRGGRIAPERVPILIDELPLLGLLGPLTREGVEVRGAAELRVKESDRIATTCAAVRSLGGEVEEYPDGFAVRGGTGLSGGEVEAAGDHRIALAAAAVSVAAKGSVRVRGAEASAVSWPGFDGVLAALAAR